MSTKSKKKEKQNKERKNIEVGIGSPTASAKRPLSPGAATLLATTIDAPKELPVSEFRPPMPKPKPKPRLKHSVSTVFSPVFDMPERTRTPRRDLQEDVDDFEGSFEDFQSVAAPDVPLKKGGGYMYPSLKNYMKRSKRKTKRKSKRKSKRKTKKNSKKNSKKKSKKARRRH